MTTLGDYARWLRSIGGQCRSGIRADHNVGMVPVTKLIGPSGASLIWNGNDQSEELSSYIIEQFDRRLGVLSPFPGVKRS